MTEAQNTPLPPYHPAWIIATWFGSGKAPKAPGTFGSAATIPFFFLYLQTAPSIINSAIISLIIMLVGTWASNIYMKASGTHDPKEIVIDEVLGQFMVLSFIFYIFCGFNCSTQDATTLTPTAFAAFRFFDVLKPWPIGWCDKNIKGGFGVMFDDLLAAIQGCLCIYLVNMFL